MKAIDDILVSAPDYGTHVSCGKCVILWGKYQTKYVWVREASVRAGKAKTYCRSCEPAGEKIRKSKLNYDIQLKPFYTHILYYNHSIYSVLKDLCSFCLFRIYRFFFPSNTVLSMYWLYLYLFIIFIHKLYVFNLNSYK